MEFSYLPEHIPGPSSSSLPQPVLASPGHRSSWCCRSGALWRAGSVAEPSPVALGKSCSPFPGESKANTDPSHPHSATLARENGQVHLPHPQQTSHWYNPQITEYRADQSARASFFNFFNEFNLISWIRSFAGRGHPVPAAARPRATVPAVLCDAMSIISIALLKLACITNSFTSMTDSG